MTPDYTNNWCKIFHLETNYSTVGIYSYSDYPLEQRLAGAASCTASVPIAVTGSGTVIQDSFGNTINWQDIGAIKAKTDTINWMDVKAIEQTSNMINWTDAQTLQSVTSIKALTDIIAANGLNGLGINWNDFEVQTNSGVNWKDIAALTLKGINWSDMNVLSNVGINWSDFGVLTKQGINWTDLKKL